MELSFIFFLHDIEYSFHMQQVTIAYEHYISTPHEKMYELNVSMKTTTLVAYIDDLIPFLAYFKDFA